MDFVLLLLQQKNECEKIDMNLFIFCFDFVMKQKITKKKNTIRRKGVAYERAEKGKGAKKKKIDI